MRPDPDASRFRRFARAVEMASGAALAMVILPVPTSGTLVVVGALTLLVIVAAIDFVCGRTD